MNALTLVGMGVVIALACLARYAQRRHARAVEAERQPVAQVFNFELARDLRDARRAREIRKASAYRETL